MRLEPVVALVCELGAAAPLRCGLCGVWVPCGARALPVGLRIGVVGHARCDGTLSVVYPMQGLRGAVVLVAGLLWRATVWSVFAELHDRTIACDGCSYAICISVSGALYKARRTKLKRCAQNQKPKYGGLHFI